MSSMKIIDYNRRAAVAYARRWAFARNPKYYNFDKLGGDCTNFASQCIYGGNELYSRIRLVLHNG